MSAKNSASASICECILTMQMHPYPRPRGAAVYQRGHSSKNLGQR